MNLINEQDDVARGLDFADKPLDALLKLAAELGAGHKAGHIQQIDFLILQAGRNLALGNALGNAFGNRGLADTGLANQAGVVLLAAAEDLNRAVNFAVTADNAVGLAIAGLLGQVLAVSFRNLRRGALSFLPLLALVSSLLACAEAEGEHRAAAGHKIILRGGLVIALGIVTVHHGGHHTRVGSLLQEAAHPFLYIFQILIGHTKLLHQIIHRLDVHGAGAGQAVALLHGLAVLKPLHKHNGGSLLAFYTKHSITSIKSEHPENWGARIAYYYY